MPLPLVDLSDATPQGAARQAAALDRALREQGFLAITGHGVPPATVEAAFDASRRFFALPVAVKERWHVNALKRGYDPVGWQALDPAQPPDLKESFYLSIERGLDHPLVRAGVGNQGPNQWPDEAQVPGFRAACDAYSKAMLALATRLMGLFERALGLPAGHFAPFMQDPTATTRLLHYPPQPEGFAPLPGQAGCGAHTDWGALTLLAQDEAGGLQVQRADGSWLDAQPVPGSFVVNAGDMLQRWTNDHWRSTVHRVVALRPGVERFSIAYFFDLNHFARIEPLPGCVSADRPARYAPVTAGEHLIEMYRRTTVGN